MTKEYKIVCGNVELIATKQPSGRATLSYDGSDSHIIDFVNRINAEESTTADILIALEDVYGEDGVSWKEL